MSGKVITTVTQIENDARIHEARGAERERRRIRRAQREALATIDGFNVPEKTWRAAINAIDAATKAPRKGRGR